VAEKLMGKLYADIAYGEIDEIFETGIHSFTDILQFHMNDVHEAIWATFFH
jgi:uncharacterized alpha-E superfamily protein